MQKLLGGLFVLSAAIGLAIGGFWGFMKASGAEVDICDGGNCTSAWYYAGPILVGALMLGAIGVALLRGERHGARSG
jgi:hypothetical protein